MSLDPIAQVRQRVERALPEQAGEIDHDLPTGVTVMIGLLVSVAVTAVSLVVASLTAIVVFGSSAPAVTWIFAAGMTLTLTCVVCWLLEPTTTRLVAASIRRAKAGAPSGELLRPTAYAAPSERPAHEHSGAYHHAPPDQTAEERPRRHIEIRLSGESQDQGDASDQRSRRDQGKAQHRSSD